MKKILSIWLFVSLCVAFLIAAGRPPTVVDNIAKITISDHSLATECVVPDAVALTNDDSLLKNSQSIVNTTKNHITQPTPKPGAFLRNEYAVIKPLTS